MTEYKTLAELKKAYESGRIPEDNERLVIDNDEAFLYVGDDKVFQSGPYEMLRSALDLLGIPWDNA